MQRAPVLGAMAVTLALLAPIAVAPVSSQSALPTRLVQASDLRHIGSFDLPDAAGAGDRRCFEYQYPGAMGYNPATNSLIVKSHDWDAGWAGEVNIPSSFTGTASVRQGCRDITAGRINQINGEGNRVHIAGILVKGSNMLVSAFPYYANGTNDGTHFSRSTTFTNTSVRGPIRVGSTPSATIGGYMAHIPAAWQGVLRGDMLTGQCCISIISRSSFGPSVSATYFDQVLTQNQVSATTLVNYPASNPLAPYGSSTPTELWNGFTRIRGVAFPEGTASVLFFGRHGTGEWFYGEGGSRDPQYQDQGEHAPPYRAQVWAYNAHEMAQVAAGQRQPHSLRPYAVFELPGMDGVEVAGAALDASGRLYILENSGGPGPRGRVHVYTVTGSEAPPAGDITAPSVSLNAISGSTVSGTVTLSATASDNTGVASVWFTVDGTTTGAEDTTSPYQTAWNTATAANGTRVVRAMARDAAGNTATSSPVNLIVNNTTADNSAPSVSLTAPAAGATVSGTVAVTAEASDNTGVASVQFTLNGVNLGAPDTTAPYSINWVTTGAANGTHQIRALARDAAGNVTTSAARQVTVNNVAAPPPPTTPPPSTTDSIRPSISIRSPGDGVRVSGRIEIRAEASDNVGVTNVRFTVNDRTVGSVNGGGPYTASWDTTGVRNGSYVITATATDAAGNSRTTSVSVSVENRSSGFWGSWRRR